MKTIDSAKRLPELEIGVAFDRAGLERDSSARKRWLWRDPAGTLVEMHFHPAAPAGWTADLESLDALRAGLRNRNSTWGGYHVAIIECDRVTVDGCEALRMLTKEPLNFGVMYRGKLTIPFEDASYVLTVWHCEGGHYSWGGRELRDCVVFKRAVSGGTVRLQEIDGVERARGWYHDLYDEELNETTMIPFRQNKDDNSIRYKKLSALRCLADDESFDAEFPDHALSRMRRMLARIQSSLSLAPEVKARPPFRLPRGK